MFGTMEVNRESSLQYITINLYYWVGVYKTQHIDWKLSERTKHKYQWSMKRFTKMDDFLLEEWNSEEYASLQEFVLTVLKKIIANDLADWVNGISISLTRERRSKGVTALG